VQVGEEREETDCMRMLKAEGSLTSLSIAFGSVDAIVEATISISCMCV